MDLAVNQRRDLRRNQKEAATTQERCQLGTARAPPHPTQAKGTDKGTDTGANRIGSGQVAMREVPAADEEEEDATARKRQKVKAAKLGNV